MFFFPIGTKEVAKEESTLICRPTIRHTCCPILLSSSLTRKRCSSCNLHRHTLCSLASRIENSEHNVDRSDPCSHVNYRFLSTPEKTERLQRMHSELRRTELQKNRLKLKLNEAVEKDGVVVDPVIHADLQNIMSIHEKNIVETYPEDSFQHIFWMQQQKAAKLRNACSMKWHPLLIKWCIYLRHVSGRAYKTLRSSGCIHLPSQRTLRDYTHFFTTCTGFSDEIDIQLALAADIDNCPECEKYTAIIFDEMYIKEDLVYNKHTNNLVGFANLGETNNHLLAFERSLQAASSNDKLELLARTMMVMMVRGLFSRLEFPYVQLPCNKLVGDLLFQPFWEAVRRIEFSGLKVIAATADGASMNRRFFRLHNLSSKTMPHMVTNPYTSEERKIHFFSDVPHLMKTVRNGIASKTRSLWVRVTKYPYISLLVKIIYVTQFIISSYPV